MGAALASGRVLALAAGEVAAETLWPSRCAVCGALGPALCEACRRALPYLDLWRACPRCGAPFGMHQCTECNTYSLRSLGVDALAFDGCVSACAFDERTARIVRLHKDAGERSLARPMAYAIACAVPPAWVAGAQVAFVPSTRRAVRERGFCHGSELATEVAGLLGLACADLLEAGAAADQRALGRAQRAKNMRGRFRALPGASGMRILLVDDVYTTGSTANAAATALREAGAERVHVATFARVV